MKQHCLIIDDNKVAAGLLKGLLEAIEDMGAVHVVSEPNAVRAVLRNFNAAVVYIRMDLWNVRLFENCVKLPVVVFLSAKTDHYLEAVHGQLDFHLAEPFTETAVKKMQERITVHKAETRIDFFFVRTQRRWRKVHFPSIDLFERKEDGYVMLYTTPTNYMLYGSMQHWLDKLPADKFIRVADQLILPAFIARKHTGKQYTYKGRTIELTFRIASKAKKELEGVGWK
ncbi:MAG: LytTR family transcriptional regulator DNA-binding domain-containing protein [Sediminibacterium sp.]